MLPPSLLPTPSSMSAPTDLHRSASSSADIISASQYASPALSHHSPRLSHTAGVGVRRPRANTDYGGIRSRHHSQHQHPYPYRRLQYTAGDYVSSGAGAESGSGYATTTATTAGGAGSLNYATSAATASNSQHNNWTLPDPNNNVFVSTPSSSPNPFQDITISEDRKPSIGINGSPHPPNTTLLPPPPNSPSLSSRSRDSPLGSSSFYPPISSSGYHSSASNSANYSPISGDHSLPTVPSSSTAFSHLNHTGQYSPFYMSSNATHPNLSNVAATGLSPQTIQEYEERIAYLTNKLHEMEFHRRRDLTKLQELQAGQEIEQQITRDVDAQFKASWDARKEARIKSLCALNRAGNALCAWHDSRRERRQYPPRMAPTGVLNCGCTYDQALFEESLTRQGVGAYQPGESVRMDPALRNPLLALLQRRYGYRDGDFERVRIEKDGEETWAWPENDDARAWTTGRAQIGNSSGANRRVTH